MAKGDLRVEKMHLRRKDMFQPMALAVNELSDSLQKPIQELQNLCLELASGTRDDAQHLDRVREILSRFKTS